ncbi:hypothetical protein NUU61_001444 [Penicillium alfredii]|uniref:Uncharacterized protein n=1 Tax=Penicillium alfredii TaxID=1506179 RepID=A0A9W9G4C8_9EURO|nr:uncharacterized protein NUU61_001444 [Penicillium alfredii]KAJ5111814.1 hypothetical protein NUU61_001444 [Penicillium alfredii]
MDALEILRTIVALNTRALLAERSRGRLDHELATTREALKQTTDDLQETVRLADLLYQVSQRMGAVTDYLLKERSIKDGSQDPESFELMLNKVVKQLEAEESKNGEGKSDEGAGPHAEAAGTAELDD